MTASLLAWRRLKALTWEHPKSQSQIADFLSQTFPPVASQIAVGMLFFFEKSQKESQTLAIVHRIQQFARIWGVRKEALQGPKNRYDSFPCVRQSQAESQRIHVAWCTQALALISLYMGGSEWGLWRWGRRNFPIFFDFLRFPWLFFAFLRAFFVFLRFPSFSSLLFAFLCLSLFLLEEKGKRLQFTAKMGISLRPCLHRPHAELPDLWGPLSQRAQRSNKFEVSSEIENFEREWNFRASHPLRPHFLWGIRDVEIEILEWDKNIRSRLNFFLIVGPSGFRGRATPDLLELHGWEPLGLTRGLSLLCALTCISRARKRSTRVKESKP